MREYCGKIPSVESEKGSSGRASGGVGASTLEAHRVGGDPETAKKVRRSVETLDAASRDESLKAHDTTQVGGKESQPLQRREYVKGRKNLEVGDCQKKWQFVNNIVSTLQRGLFKLEDDGSDMSPFRAIAEILYEVSRDRGMPELYREVHHYLSFYRERDEWYAQTPYKKVAIGGINYCFSADLMKNSYFGCPEDAVMPTLAREIAKASNIYLKYFDTEEGRPCVRGNWLVGVVPSTRKEDSEYGVRWVLRKGDVVEEFPIEHFAKGRENLLNIVAYMWWQKPLVSEWLQGCRDFAEEMQRDIQFAGHTDLPGGEPKAEGNNKTKKENKQ